LIQLEQQQQRESLQQQERHSSLQQRLPSFEEEVGEEEIVLVLVLEVQAVGEQLWVQVAQVVLLIQVQVVLLVQLKQEELQSLPQSLPQ